MSTRFAPNDAATAFIDTEHVTGATTTDSAPSTNTTRVLNTDSGSTPSASAASIPKSVRAGSWPYSATT